MKTIVLLFGQYPLKFSFDRPRLIASAVGEDQATRFDSEEAAHLRAAEQGWKPDKYTLQSVNK